MGLKLRLACITASKFKLYEISQFINRLEYQYLLFLKDLFATFAEVIGYPLPSAEKCTYAFDETADPIPSNRYSRSMGELRRESDQFHHSHTFSSVKSNWLKNDENAKWTINTLRKTCNKAENCPCDNWVNPENPDFNQTIATKCLTDPKFRTLENCQCKPVEEDCPTGFCFSSVEISKFDWQMLTGGRDLLMETFYETGPDGSLVPVAPWDDLSESTKIQYKKKLDKIGSYNQFLTLEHKTGLILGFDGCMAEDSHSFASAFKASNKEENSGKWHRRPAQINASKLG